jgi:hypothetical protein
MVRGCVSTEFEDVPLVWPAESAGMPAFELPLPWPTLCGAPDPLPAAFANEAANTSDDPMVATARTNLFMACALNDGLSVMTPKDRPDPFFQAALPWSKPST